MDALYNTGDNRQEPGQPQTCFRHFLNAGLAPGKVAVRTALF